MINWVGFVPAAVLASLVPGANQLLGLRNAVRHGPGYAMAGIGGRLAAFVVLIGLVVAGLGAALAASVTALTVLKWVGVGYLVWIGFTSIRHALRAPGTAEVPVAATAGRPWALARNEFAVAISNPKALLLFAALLPQFTTGGGLAWLGVAYLGIELLIGMAYVVVGSRIGAGGIPARTQRRIDFGAGFCFLGLAGLLALDEVG